jgi:hypothetical protein
MGMGSILSQILLLPPNQLSLVTAELGSRPSPPGETLLELNNPVDLPALRLRVRLSNAQDRPGMWARGDPQALETLVSPFAGFLNRLGQLCLGAEIRECRNQACLGNKQLIQDIVPACEWKGFRDCGNLGHVLSGILHRQAEADSPSYTPGHDRLPIQYPPGLVQE